MKNSGMKKNKDKISFKNLQIFKKKKILFKIVKKSKI